MKKLIKVQSELKAPKNQYNKFGKYHYRSKEDILEAVKPLLAANDLLMTLTDEVKTVGAFTFVETIIRIDDGKDFAEARGVAGIEKAGGMQLPQAFGSASSYSGKYALQNMFLLDDTKDADATNDHGKASQAVTPNPLSQEPTPIKKKPEPKKKIVFGTDEFDVVVDWIYTGTKNKAGEIKKGSVDKAVELYDIDKEQLEKILLAKTV